MDFHDALMGRRSIRLFQERDIPEGVVDELIKGALLAPSPGDYRGIRFILVRDEGMKRKMKDAVQNRYNALLKRSPDRGVRMRLKRSLAYAHFFSDAPLVIGVAYTFYRSAVDDSIMEADGLSGADLFRVRENPGLQGASASVQNLLLCAHAMGLGACWMTAPLTAKGELEEILGIEPPYSLMAIVPVGYPRRRLKPNRPPEGEELEGFIVRL